MNDTNTSNELHNLLPSPINQPPEPANGSNSNNNTNLNALSIISSGSSSGYKSISANNANSSSSAASTSSSADPSSDNEKATTPINANPLSNSTKMRGVDTLNTTADLLAPHLIGEFRANTPSASSTSSSHAGHCRHNSSTTAANNATGDDYLNKKIAFIQNHINNLLIEITNLPSQWTYAVTEDGRVFFIK